MIGARQLDDGIRPLLPRFTFRIVIAARRNSNKPRPASSPSVVSIGRLLSAIAKKPEMSPS
jgi:hypothetical protein